MISLDSNVLLRLILRDDESQARTVEQFLVRARRDQTMLFIADTVLAEVARVLKRQHAMTRERIADVLEAVVDTELMELASTAAVSSAIRSYRSGRGDFADYLIREQARLAGATEVVTFDLGLVAEEGFRQLG